MTIELDSTIAQTFASHMEDIAGAAVALSAPLQEASQVMVHALLSDSKILCAGGGTSNALAQLLVSQLVNYFAHDRPGLPAIALSSDSCLVNSLSDSSQFAETLARQVSTLGSQGDILFLLAGQHNNDALVRALRAAHDRDMTVVLCYSDGNADVASLLGPRDVELAIPVEPGPRSMEIYLVLINCLCQLIELSLFGAAS